MSKESVNHPEHYNQYNIEAIDVISFFCDVESFALGNAIKYIMRAPYKKDAPFVEHLKKADWYIDYIRKNKKGNARIRLLEPKHIQSILSLQKKYSEGNRYEQDCAKLLSSFFKDLVLDENDFYYISEEFNRDLRLKVNLENISREIKELIDIHTK